MNLVMECLSDNENIYTNKCIYYYLFIKINPKLFIQYRHPLEDIYIYIYKCL